MRNVAISIENLSKSYLIGHNLVSDEGYRTLSDSVVRNANNLARKTRDMFLGKSIVQGDEIEEFWALKDISLEINHGDRIGIVGRNGAGKSTLLKLLSRITEPTTGRISINGRVAALLEVGTGFHPELSGRENIYLNAAILGMSRKEIQQQFDEIVDFAEIETFLDTPVKRYSSGMYVRLAFSIAAHLDNEILILDEVLAVGDAQFQKKCLSKMLEVSTQSSRTVIFVSHNIGAIKSMCTRAICMDKGKIIADGTTDEAIEKYLNVEVSQQKSWFASDDKKSNLIVLDFFIRNEEGVYVNSVRTDARYEFVFEIFCKIKRPIIYYISVEDMYSNRILLLTNKLTGFEIKHENEFKKVICSVPRLSLVPGRYFVSIKITDGNEVYLWKPQAFFLDVEYGESAFALSGLDKSLLGSYLAEHTWRLE